MPSAAGVATWGDSVLGGRELVPGFVVLAVGVAGLERPVPPAELDHMPTAYAPDMSRAIA